MTKSERMYIINQSGLEQKDFGDTFGDSLEKELIVKKSIISTTSSKPF